MANRFPLVLDTTDNNKIKEIQAGDNLNLTDNSITGVQNITALGTINAADVRVNGNRLVAQAFADLTDTPSSFVGSPNYFVKVKADGTGLEYRPLSDLGNIEIDTITVDTSIVPSADGVGNVGTEAAKFNEIVATTLKGNLVSFNEEIVFDASEGKISYAALQGAPEFLSEFTDDVGFLKTTDLDDQLAGLFDDGSVFVTDIQGSVFGDDSTLLVDGIASKIVGDIDFGTTPGFIEGDEIVILPTDGNAVSIGTARLLDTLTPEFAQGGAIGTEELPFNEANFITVKADNISTDAVNLSEAIGVAQLTASTDLAITAGNRVKILGGVPFRFSSTTSADQLAIGAQEGDVIYNTTTSRLQMYQGGDWKDVNGNVEATAGTSNFNDVVVAGNLTVSGTTTTVDTENTTISDNVIVLNNGESGAGVTAGTSGIEIDRGSETNKTLVWDETDDKWTVGSETFAANTFEAVGFQGSLFGNGGLNSPLQLTSGLEGQTGNTIFINPQGSDTLVQMWGETVNLVTGPFNTYDSPYVQFKTEGAFKTHQGAYFDGNLIGDVKGSIVGDDSTILVDGVAGIITGDVENTEVITSTVQGRASAALNIYRGAGGTVSLGDASSGDVTVSDSGINITSTGGVAVNGAAGGTVDIGTSATTGNVTIGKVGNTTTIDGTFNAALTGDVTGNVTGNVTGDVTGNIDNATLTIGATNATTITIGSSSSTTTINGTVNLPALIAGEITADDSIIIQTEGNSASEAITIFPKGTDTSIYLRADALRLLGTPFADSITAQAGIVGDIKGSVVADDSTILVDSVNGNIVGDVASTNIHGQAFKADTIVNNTSTTLDITADTFLNLFGGGSDLGISNIQLDKNGINYIELKTEPGNPANPSDYARVAINAGTNEGDVRIGTPVSTRNQVVEIYNATVNGTLVGAVTGAVTGSVTGELQGSVFADDSSIMVDGVNYAMFSDTLSLTPLNAEPVSPVSGMIVAADGTTWDPASKSGAVSYPVFYDGLAWNALY